MDILLLLAGLALILGGANFLTDGAAAIAQRLRIPEFVVGLTVVAIGTSTPELVVSLLSAAGGQSDVALGNVVGSNLFNTLVIVGLCALVRPLPLTPSNIRRDIPFGVAAALLLLLAVSDRWLGTGDTGRITRAEGIVMLGLYVALLYYTVRREGRTTEGKSGEAGAAPTRPMAGWLAATAVAGGLAGLVFGGELFLRSATAIARSLGVGEATIAITLVAGGTSLPELASALVSVAKGKSEMALGNVVGSNIANILLILGASASLRPLTAGGITPVDTAMVAVSAVLLLLTARTFRRGVVDRREGALFLALYGGYLWWLIG